MSSKAPGRWGVRTGKGDRKDLIAIVERFLVITVSDIGLTSTVELLLGLSKVTL